MREPPMGAATGRPPHDAARVKDIMGKPHLLGHYTSLALLALLVVSPSASAQEAPAEAPAPQAAEDGDDQPADAPPEEAPGGIEFVDEGPSPFANDDEPMDLPDIQEDVDETAPTIDDFAVAAGSPDAAVRVTAVVTDDASGIEAVEIFYRIAKDAEYAKVTLEPQQGGLFMGILPDGPQRSGFAYYAQARDAAGNVATLGDPERPYKVDAPRESGLARLERSKQVVENEPTVAPIWIAATLGVGVIGAAGAALFLVDFARLWFVLLPQETTGTVRHTQIQQLAYGDAIIGGVLAVLGLAGLVTGTGLLIFAALEE